MKVHLVRPTVLLRPGYPYRSRYSFEGDTSRTTRSDRDTMRDKQGLQDKDTDTEGPLSRQSGLQKEVSPGLVYLSRVRTERVGGGCGSTSFCPSFTSVLRPLRRTSSTRD